jgi:hypothetical protein
MATHPPERPDENYPSALRDAEHAAIAARRHTNNLPPPAQAPIVGVALSGGGIRSATFCLGLFQALARQKLVRKIDLLSTVSGGGYFGSFLGASFTREAANADTVEKELGDNQSWSVRWLRDNGRFLSPNGSGDTWQAIAVALRNWTALHVVLLTFVSLMLSLGALIRANFCTGTPLREPWLKLEDYLWNHAVGGIWWSPWIILPVASFLLLMLPTGTLYWFTQFMLPMKLVRRLFALVRPSAREWSDNEFVSRSQSLLTRSFMSSLVLTLGLCVFVLVGSLGQTLYLRWEMSGFAFPTEWVAATGASAGLYAFARKIFVFAQGLLSKRKLTLPFDFLALVFALAWLLLIFVGLSVLVCRLAWGNQAAWDYSDFHAMNNSWGLAKAVAITFLLSWLFSRSFGFVNLSSLQQVYAARLRRAYLGASNPRRRAAQNFSMTDLMPGDDLDVAAYRPHHHGGPLHMINVTVNETLSGKTQIERRDRKGLIMAVGPCGVSVGTHSHALWADAPAAAGGVFSGLFDDRSLPVLPVALGDARRFHALHASSQEPAAAEGAPTAPRKIEALSIGRWVAISGAAFTTGIGAGTKLGLSLLLGLGNVRLGYWWNSGINPHEHGQSTPPTFTELGARLLSRVLPVQMCLVNEFFARFHGPARRHWYLSDGGHFENTACYELIRRRVPFIICSDAGQDPAYRFDDLANLVRIVRTDFNAEIQVVRRRDDPAKDDPDAVYAMPFLEDLVHPELLDVIGAPEDFVALAAKDAPPAYTKRHALLARIRYLDTHQFSWLLLIKPSLMGDEAMDVVQYQRTHPLFPQEPTSDQYFDEAQWESYRKLGEHIGAELFTPPVNPGEGWSPSQFRPPQAG